MLKDLCFDSGYLGHSETAHPTVNGRYLRHFTTLLGLILIDLFGPSGRGTQDRTGRLKISMYEGHQ